jgi:SAM-dependent methyltransferase
MNPEAQRAQRQAVWTRHWSTGAAHSCAGSFGDTYGGALAQAWRLWHADTAPGCRVLDVASGSAALPRLLLELRPDLAMDVDAVDLAHTTPAWLGQRPAGSAVKLRFHTGVAAESLPFEDGSFDAVISQYGLEYADTGTALSEALRVLAPHGRIALVLHHAASRPVTLAAVEIAHIDWLLGEQGLVAAVRGMLAPMASAATLEGRARLAQDPTADAARRRFNAAQAELRQRAQVVDGADVLGEAQDGAARLLQLAVERGETAAHQAWQQLERGLSDARWRLQELQARALDATAAHQLCAQLQQRGKQSELGTIEEQGHLMGWQLRAR